MAVASSCKQNDDPAPGSVVGSWIGKYSTNATTVPNITWDTMILTSSGALQGSDRMGTFNVSGNVITATYVRTGTTFSFRCDIKEDFNKLEGTWGNGASQTNGGLMVLTKQ
ncbi:hypothetical protein GCM10028803_48900 [Larkinella knui]|uniref:Lipocalin-like domain-containing protein n=1 Tax=Larkinella knui TaxID=2025310 RepID=A0A3P1CQF4_9BACT|nr:hypothetical protein [Larkinella knui]RRB15461.1 hypothetical protein EHT87_13120 [Larkinella knui]